MLEGSFALAILFAEEPETIYCTCKDSPMVVGHGTNESIIASDIPAILEYTRDVYFVQDRQIAVLKKTRRTATVRATTPTKLLVLDAGDLQTLMASPVINLFFVASSIDFNVRGYT